MAEVERETKDAPTVDITETPSAETPATEPKQFSPEEARESGWSEKEIELAQKKGMLSGSPKKKGEGEEEPAPAAATGKQPEGQTAPAAGSTGEEPGEEPAPEAGKKPEAGKTPGKAPKGSLPNVDLTPEEEEQLTKIFKKGHPVRAFYFRAKNERRARQNAEADKRASDEKNRVLEARIEALEKMIQGGGAAETPTDDQGNPIDPDAQPATIADIKRLEEEKAKKQAKATEEHNQRAQALQAAHTEQEEYARSLFEDFDDTVKLSKAVLSDIEGVITDPVTRAKVMDLAKQLHDKAINADKLPIDGYHAAFIAYEIGQLHPEYNKGNGETPNEESETETEAETTGEPQNPKANGSHTPEQLKRIAKNTQRRGSSASVPSGGGKRTVAVSDVTREMLVKMDYRQRAAFREKHPDKYRELVRG